jgi:beta-glucanase (GH16 family)
MESRGNRQLFNGNTNVGVEQFASTLHFGPDANHNGFMHAHYEKNNRPGFDRNFHNYKLEWTPNHLKFFVDNQLIGTVNPGE